MRRLTYDEIAFLRRVRSGPVCQRGEWVYVNVPLDGIRSSYRAIVLRVVKSGRVMVAAGVPHSGKWFRVITDPENVLRTDEASITARKAGLNDLI